MTTFADMTDQVIADLSSYVHQQESITVLTAGIDADDLTIQIDDPSALSKGLVEIGDELVYLKSVTATSAVATVMPGGRGFDGTTAATHGQYSIVRNSPLFPRSSAQRAMNETLISCGLKPVLKHDVEFDGTTFAYVLPAGADDVISVSYEKFDSTGVWPLLRNWRVDRNYWSDGATSAEVALILHEAPPPGQTLRIQYIGDPTPLTTADDFSDSGLPASAEDVIRFGAMWRLVSKIDPGRVSAQSPMTATLDVRFQTGKASDVSKYLYQLYSARLSEELSRQQDKYVNPIHYLG